MNHLLIKTALCGVLVCGSQATLACDLKIGQAWIRAAPPNAMALAGYAVLQNTASKPLTIASLSSPLFAEVSAHETVTTNGMASMQALDKFVIPANGKVELAPGGKHLMLMNPKQALRAGDSVTLNIKDDRGCTTAANFVVTADGAHQAEMDRSHMRHDK